MKKLILFFMPLMLVTSMALAQTQSSPATQTTKKEHVKKDGHPDKRYKENKHTMHVKKDGTPDERYKENKTKK